MILFVDDEDRRTQRWREALAAIDTVHSAQSAGAALRLFQEPGFVTGLRLVVLDLAMHATGGLTADETAHGRLTGDAVRKRIRESGWAGPIIVLTNARDDATQQRVEAGKDHFRRKGECPPSALQRLAATLVGGESNGG